VSDAGASNPARSPSPARCQLILAIAVILVFGRLVMCDFVWWDDAHTVHHNPSLNPTVTWSGIAYNWTHSTASIYIPLTYTVWALLAIVARVSPDEVGIALNPLWYHAANVLVHGIAALLAFRLLDRLLKHRRAALVGAMLFALHPVQVESVAWISGLKDVLAGCLAIGCLYVYCDEPLTRRRRMLAILLFVLAMLAKPSAMVAPLLLLAIDVLAVRRGWRASLARVAPLVLLAVPIAIIARIVQIAPAAPAPLWARPLIALDSLAFYIAKVFIPITLTIDYGRKPAEVIASGAIGYTWILVAIALIAIAWLARVWRVSPIWCAAWIFVLAPLPVLGLMRFDFQEVSTVADHYLYLAMLGPALLAGVVVSRYPRVTPIMLMWVGLLGARSFVQTFVWQDEMSLMTHALSANDRSTVAHNNLANQASLRRDDAGERAHLLSSIAIDPSEPVALRALGLMALRDGDAPAAEAYFHRLGAAFDAVYGAGDPRTARPRWQAADAFLDADRTQQAQRFADEAKRLAPDHPNVKRIAERLRFARSSLLRGSNCPEERHDLALLLEADAESVGHQHPHTFINAVCNTPRRLAASAARKISATATTPHRTRSPGTESRRLCGLPASAPFPRARRCAQARSRAQRLHPPASRGRTPRSRRPC